MTADLAFLQPVLDGLDPQAGLHPGCRPLHANGVCSGTFTPAPKAAQPTRAPQSSRLSTR